jgi:soluble lytic murein transglycosylase-like protein
MKKVLAFGAIIAGLIIAGLKAGIIRLPAFYSSLRRFEEEVLAASRKYGVDPALIYAVIYQESRGNPNAVSGAGAIGLMQIMPQTASSVCLIPSSYLLSPSYNIDCGAKYLSYLLNKYRDVRRAVAKYYGGEKAEPYSTFGSPPVWKYVEDVMWHYANIRGIL